MKKCISIVLLLLSIAGYAQPLRDINYVYLYNPDEVFSFHLKYVRGAESFTVLYSLQVKDTTGLTSDFTIQWEGRARLSDREGTPVPFTDHITSRNASGLEGRVTLSIAQSPKYLVARVTRNSASRAWLFYTGLDVNHPVNDFLIHDDSYVDAPYVYIDKPVKLALDSNRWMASYYNDNFPAAAPAFSEALARVPRQMEVDSSYYFQAGEDIVFSREGLYLIQRDTNSLQGVAFRAQADYPQYTKLVNLAGPLIYICTKQEFDRLQMAKDNKRGFDRVILSMANDTERARKLMRNYFRRVELANRYFTSYKEGWKTDRGMMYIIFGMPDEVYRFSDREVWNYKNDQLDERFIFSRSGSLFDPDNYVLIRDKKYQDVWYEVVDLWRNARF